MAERPRARARLVVEPFGDAALMIVLGDRVDAGLTARARTIAAALDDARSGQAGISLGRPVVAHASVLVPFDPLAIDREDARRLIRSVGAEAWRSPATDQAAPEPIEIPVRYGGPDGPDLDAAAEALGMRAADIVELHASASHRVLFLGFAPGFAYIGGLPPAMAMARRASPRERVPAGSVGIAGEHTGVYPRDMPGGWNLIGRTDVVLFDPGRPDPALLRPGAAVRFVPVR